MDCVKFLNDLKASRVSFQPAYSNELLAMINSRFDEMIALASANKISTIDCNKIKQNLQWLKPYSDDSQAGGWAGIGDKINALIAQANKDNCACLIPVNKILPQINIFHPSLPNVSYTVNHTDGSTQNIVLGNQKG